MAWAEFEEKEFETASNLELGARGGTVLSPGQVLEKILGYDLAAHPHAENLVWRVLQVERPSGLRLMPSLWEPGRQPSGSALPRSPVSLIVQYKRPEFIRGHRGTQWHLWHQPYYRITRTSSQHRVLRRLERKMGGDAVVRYAAPAFWRRSELEAAHLERSTLRRSGFVAPSVIGSHKVWTYIGPGVDGRANPSGPPRAFETDATLMDLLYARQENAANLVLAGEPLFVHLSQLANAATDREPGVRALGRAWRSVLVREIQLAPETVNRLVSLASVATIMVREGLSWRILDRDVPPA